MKFDLINPIDLIRIDAFNVMKLSTRIKFKSGRVFGQQK